MPCEVASRIVNNTYTNIAVELEVDSPQKGTMYEQKLKFCRPSTSIDSGRHNGKPVEKCCQEDLEMVDNSEQKPNPKMSQKENSYQVFGYRSLPRVFSGLGEFGVIEETESAVDDVCVVSPEWSSVPLLQQSHILRRKSPTKVTTKEIHGADWLASSRSSAKNDYLRRSSEGSVYVVSARGDGRSGEYQNYSDPILREQRSEREESIDILEQVNDTRSSRLVNGSSRRSSFAAMNAIPETLSDNQRYYSLPRKLSLPIENSRSSATWNGKKQRHSFSVNPGDTGTFAALDNDTDVQWKMLVARAKNFQKLSSKEPKGKSSFEDVKIRKETKDLETESVDRDREDICDRRVIKMNSKENHESNETTKSQQDKLQESIQSSDGIESKESSSMPLTGEEEVGNAGQVDLTVKNNPNKHDFDPQPRRYSLATVHPSPEVREKISGYSTHGALEYAKMLLGKIQSEGKSKSKKERLEEMSKALKMILEELNRIDLPDRESVSLFISLRAKIVNLKAELKAEETQVLSRNDKETDSNARILAQTLPRVRSTSESIITRPNFRRFSWC